MSAPSEEHARRTRARARPGRGLIAFLLCLAAPTCFASALRAAVLDPRTVESSVLGNGLRVIVCEDKAASVVSVEVVVRVGSADDPPGEGGLAHLLEHVCWVGSPEADPRSLVEDAGGVTNAGTLRDLTRFYATVPPTDLGVALRALAAMTLRREFDEAVVSRERALILDEAATRMDRPRAALNDLAFETVYGSDHPYGHHIEGTQGSLAGLDSAALTIFYRDWYVPNNMAVVIAGQVRFEAAVSEVGAAFGAAAPAALPRRSTVPIERRARAEERAVETPLREAYLMAAFVGPAVYEREPLVARSATEGRPAQEPYLPVCSSDLLATILGHPQVGRLVRELQVSRGLVRRIGVDFLTQRERGIFGIWAISHPSSIEAVKEAVREQLSRLAREPVSPGELVAAKRLLAAEYTFANETPADRVGTLGFYEAVDRYQAATHYLSRVQAITAADIAAMAAWYAGEPTWVIMRPGEAAP